MIGDSPPCENQAPAAELWPQPAATGMDGDKTKTQLGLTCARPTLRSTAPSVMSRRPSKLSTSPLTCPGCAIRPMLERGSQSSGHLMSPTTRCAVLYASQGVAPPSLTDLRPDTTGGGAAHALLQAAPKGGVNMRCSFTSVVH